jgi:hypothetical protein
MAGEYNAPTPRYLPGDLMLLFPPRRTPSSRLSNRSVRAQTLALIACALIGLQSQSVPAAEVVTNGLTRVRIETNAGNFTIVTEGSRAPLTTANFLSYVRSGFYNGTVFHRVIAGFVVQGGGFDEKGNVKTTQANIANESGNGLSNKRGTIGLARSDAPHSGNAQFYVNVTDNDSLDPTPLRWGYAVFGRVIEGMEVVDRLSRTPTGTVGTLGSDAPLESVVIKRVVIVNASGEPIPQNATTTVATPATTPNETP